VKGARGRRWRGLPATSARNSLVFPFGTGRKAQVDVLIGILRNARAEGRASELPEIMAVSIAQHGTRLNEIRGRGFVVEKQPSARRE